MSSPVNTTFSIVSALLLAATSNLLLLQASTFAAPKNDTAIAVTTKAHAEQNNNGNAYGHVKKDVLAPAEITHTNTAPQTAILATSTTVPAQTSAHNPAGNNGFIKVNEEITPDSIPNNDPHVGCSFKVEFYNYDKNPDYRAQVQFALHSPTSDGRTMTVNGNLTPSIGADSAGGGNDLDAVETYRLSFTGAPHAQQGYHVKLTIHADGSQGADVKHKVFWVEPCETPVTPPTPAQPGQVLGTKISPTNTVASVLPAMLPSTGAGLIGAAVVFIGSGLTYLLAAGIQRFRARA